jgi:hypothetical protein
VKTSILLTHNHCDRITTLSGFRCKFGDLFKILFTSIPWSSFSGLCLCFAGREKSEAENFSLAEQASASRPEKSIKELPKKHTGTAEIKCSHPKHPLAGKRASKRKALLSPAQ